MKPQQYTPDFDQALLREVAAGISTGWELCELFSFTGRAIEKESMVAQTINAAVANLDKHGQPFSFRGDNCLTRHGNGLADNATAYEYLVRHEYLVERAVPAAGLKLPDDIKTRSNGTVMVLYPTKKMLEMVREHLRASTPS